MARPKKLISWELVEKKMEAGCSAKEIASSFCIEINTFYDRFKEEFGCGFADYAGTYYEAGTGNLKSVQYMKAMSGNIAMLTLLGQERWGQGKDQTQKYTNEELLAISHENMMLRDELSKLKERLDGNKSQTE